jgi:sRNA-binding protein
MRRFGGHRQHKAFTSSPHQQVLLHDPLCGNRTGCTPVQNDHVLSWSKAMQVTHRQQRRQRSQQRRQWLVHAVAASLDEQVAARQPVGDRAAAAPAQQRQQAPTDVLYDAVIVGGGMGGLTTATQMAAKGAKVLVLEK